MTWPCFMRKSLNSVRSWLLNPGNTYFHGLHSVGPPTAPGPVAGATFSVANHRSTFRWLDGSVRGARILNGPAPFGLVPLQNSPPPTKSKPGLYVTPTLPRPPVPNVLTPDRRHESRIAFAAPL